MKNFEYIEELIQCRDYSDLRPEEQKIVDAELGEAQYTEMRDGILAVQGEKLSMKQKNEEALLAAWKPERTGALSWISKPVPAYAFLLIFLFFGLLYWLTPPRLVTEYQIAEKEVPVVLRDTVTVIQVDTLWRERLVQIPTPMVVQNEQVEQQAPVQQTIQNKSISEQEELLDLVVRGE